MSPYLAFLFGFACGVISVLFVMALSLVLKWEEEAKEKEHK